MFEKVHPDARMPERRSPNDNWYTIYAAEDDRTLGFGVARTGLNISSMDPRVYLKFRPSRQLREQIGYFQCFTEVRKDGSPVWEKVGAFDSGAQIVLTFFKESDAEWLNIRKGDPIAEICYKLRVYPEHTWKQ